MCAALTNMGEEIVFNERITQYTHKCWRQIGRWRSKYWRNHTRSRKNLIVSLERCVDKHMKWTKTIILEAKPVTFEKPTTDPKKNLDASDAAHKVIWPVDATPNHQEVHTKDRSSRQCFHSYKCIHVWKFDGYFEHHRWERTKLIHATTTQMNPFKYTSYNMLWLVETCDFEKKNLIWSNRSIIRVCDKDVFQKH